MAAEMAAGSDGGAARLQLAHGLEALPGGGDLEQQPVAVDAHLRVHAAQRLPAGGSGTPSGMTSGTLWDAVGRHVGCSGTQGDAGGTKWGAVGRSGAQIHAAQGLAVGRSGTQWDAVGRSGTAPRWVWPRHQGAASRREPEAGSRKPEAGSRTLALATMPFVSLARRASTSVDTRPATAAAAGRAEGGESAGAGG